MSNMNELVGLAVGLLTLTIVLYLGPGVGEMVSKTMPINESGDFADVTTGAEVWTSGVGILGIVVTVIFVAVAIKALKGIQGNSNE
ncbi:MAG: hypothetical protein LLF94_11330 [Chlamydiales bacterium]|nr:hypothetical protein [Chlamydiales bacterium]